MSQLDLSQCVTLACLLEASIPKPGNVHRGADFEDMSLFDFLASAVAIGPAVAQAANVGVGPAVLQARRATAAVTHANTNLGTLLLLAPLAAAAHHAELREGVQQVLAALDRDDARCIYQAIREAQPGGLGTVKTMDVRDAAADVPELHAAMAAAAEHDLVARQYAHGFRELWTHVADPLRQGQARGKTLVENVVEVQLHLLSELSDSLIARKCGPAVAAEAANAGAPRLAGRGPGQLGW